VRGALALILLATATAHADLQPLIKDLPSCEPARATCLGVAVHVALDDAGNPIATAEWLAGQLAVANQLHAPVDVGFQVVSIDALPATAQRVADRKQRDAFAPQVTGTTLHVFVTGRLDDIDIPGGAVLKFGYLENRTDAYNYQGAAAHCFTFEEAGLLDPWCMQFIRTRARRPRASSIPIRFRYTANPGGEAHEWLYSRFIVLGGVDGRVFVPSKAVDNPGLDHADYLRRLDAI
jgi:hypothetical protein